MYILLELRLALALVQGLIQELARIDIARVGLKAGLEVLSINAASRCTVLLGRGLLVLLLGGVLLHLLLAFAAAGHGVGSCADGL